MTTTIFLARKVVTLDPARPEGRAIAVRDGRILGVGTVDELSVWGDHTIDDTFRDHVLFPGFVEAHAHAVVGGFWQFPYVGYYDKVAPDGVVWSGLKSLDAVIDRLRQVDAELTDPDEPIIAWALDPIQFPMDHIGRAELDRVSTTRPVFVLHLSGHVASVNSALIEGEGVDTSVTGVLAGPDGRPSGELRGVPAISAAGSVFQRLAATLMSDEAKWNYGRIARNAGVTTTTELGASAFTPEAIESWKRVVNERDFPARIAVAWSTRFDGPDDPEEMAEQAAAMAEHASEKLRMGTLAKIWADGSIQGFTARIRWPHYLTGENGMWYIDRDSLYAQVLAFHRKGLIVHAHTNGDEATDLFLDVIEDVLREAPRWDHRHTAQHNQLATADQFRRMTALGVSANQFINHIYYWGDVHLSRTVGPDRAHKMNAMATALREGTQVSMHSDEFVSPLGGLLLMWCAVNRVTASGVVLGPEERISAWDAARAVTVGAAYQLRMDHEVGTIQTGKRADFAVLEADPLEVDPMEIKDVPVWGTVVGGVPYQAGT